MKRNQKVFGFTLVEIMIVVTIIGILASLAVPAFQRARWKALETSIRNNLRQIWGAAQQYMLENGVVEVKLADIIQWESKKADEKGETLHGDTNPGYTSTLRQVADENYDKLLCQFPSENTVTTPETGTIYSEATSIKLSVTGGGGNESVILDL